MGIVALLLVVGGGSVLLTRLPMGSSARSAPRTSPVAPLHSPSVPSSGPSGSPIVPSAAAIVTNIQVASAIDGTYHPTQLTQTVAAGQTLYITFDLHLNGRTGYVLAKFYRDRDFIDKTELTVDQPDYLNGAVYGTFSVPIKNGIAELTWCQQADCSDGQVAAVAHFAVTNASGNPAATSPSAMAPLSNDADRAHRLLVTPMCRFSQQGPNAPAAPQRAA